MYRQIQRCFSSKSGGAPKTGILMMNMGGPQTLNDVKPFLTNLFTDRDIIQLPSQSMLGSFIAKRRTPKVQQKYKEIGGGSPIFKYTRQQGDLMCAQLDKISPETAPHKAYIGFRYTAPFTSDALTEIKADGVKRIVAFPQYPHYSCCTTGSSLNQLHKEVTADPDLLDLNWSFIDRWPLNEGLVDAFVDSIKAQLKEIPEPQRDRVVLLFTAHSLPLHVVARGDTYPTEIGATVLAVMKKLNFAHPYRLVWQSKVGPVPWLQPKTDDAIKGFILRGYNTVMLVPISFVNEHIETLHELDIEYRADLAKQLGVPRIFRAEAPNTNPKFIRGLADELKTHLDSGKIFSPQLITRCSHCTTTQCARLRDWIENIH